MSIIEKAIRGKEQESPKRAATVRPSPTSTGGSSQPSPDSIHWPGTPANVLLGESFTDPKFVTQFRHLKQTIIQTAFGPLAEVAANIVIVTSCSPNAGKTFVSMNIAQALAMERDRNVLLIDADDVKSTLTRTLGLDRREGFFDVLDNTKLSIDEVILQTSHPRLKIAPSGKRFSDSAELLSSRRAKDILALLSGNDSDGFIVLDSPPLIATPDASILAELAHQFLLVVEAGVTTKNQVTRALELAKGNNSVGLVLNKSPDLGYSRYGGYYYYGPESD